MNNIITLILQDGANLVTDVDGAASNYSELMFHIISGIIFSVVGIAVLGVCFWLMERITPFSIVKEIEEHQNTSLAIVMGAVVIAMAIIIAAAIHG
ncbi:MAG: DUF350 domain-containing protein [Planctomycetaceae bacterium]